jgi:hypothetical protein
MHAYQYLLTGVKIDSYTSYTPPTGIADDRSPRSTRGPVLHRKVRRLRGHLFTLFVD